MLGLNDPKLDAGGRDILLATMEFEILAEKIQSLTQPIRSGIAGAPDMHSVSKCGFRKYKREPHHGATVAFRQCSHEPTDLRGSSA